MFREEIIKSLAGVLEELHASIKEIHLEHPSDLTHGDYSTNIALMLAKKEGKNPGQLADEIIKRWQEAGLPDFIEKIEAAGVGFINIWLKFDALSNSIRLLLEGGNDFGKTEDLSNKKIMVEYAHPNTHKELHVGHMRTLITGEALARIFSFAGAEVFRANYQGDVGPHVAKSIWGTQKLFEERKIDWNQAEELSLTEKAHLLGEGYILGVKEYEKENPDESKKEIDQINAQLYLKDPEIMPVYERTRRWSLDYYDTFYTRFGTKFDQLFFESDIANEGKKIVLANLKNKSNAGQGVFEESEGAIIFDGEKYDLHKRVFITKDGNPTYEAKDLGLAYAQFKAFPFDLNIHVVANEQSGYFQVMIKALETLDPKFTGKEFHLPMGMVNLVGKKMSSRTGIILRVDELLDEVKELLVPLVNNEELSVAEKERILEVATIAAVKYSVLRVGPKQNVIFDPEKSVSLQGDSGPYLEYTYARTQSVLGKSNGKWQMAKIEKEKQDLSNEEQVLLRIIYRFPEIVGEAAKTYSPNLICNFLFDLSQKFNLFYDKERILGSENEGFRLGLTASVGQVIKIGLNLLGIEVLERM